MAAAAAAAAHPNEREALEEKIATQGDLVRALKASGGPVRADAGSDFGPVRAPKAEVDAAVAVLLRLKRQAGWPLDRPSGSRLGKDKPPPAGLVTISVAPPSRSPPLGGAGAVMGASHASGSLAGSVHGGGAFGASLGSALSEAFGPFLPTAPLQSPFRSPFHSPFQSPFQSPPEPLSQPFSQPLPEPLPEPFPQSLLQPLPQPLTEAPPLHSHHPTADSAPCRAHTCRRLPRRLPARWPPHPRHATRGATARVCQLDVHTWRLRLLVRAAADHVPRCALH